MGKNKLVFTNDVSVTQSKARSISVIGNFCVGFSIARYKVKQFNYIKLGEVGGPSLETSLKYNFNPNHDIRFHLDVLLHRKAKYML